MSRAESCINCEVGGRRPPRRFRARAPHLGVSVAQKALGAGVLPPPRPGCSAPPPSPARPPAAQPPRPLPGGRNLTRRQGGRAGGRGEAGRGGAEPFLTPHRAAGPARSSSVRPERGRSPTLGGPRLRGIWPFSYPKNIHSGTEWAALTSYVAAGEVVGLGSPCDAMEKQGSPRRTERRTDTRRSRPARRRRRPTWSASRDASGSSARGSATQRTHVCASRSGPLLRDCQSTALGGGRGQVHGLGDRQACHQSQEL